MKRPRLTVRAALVIVLVIGTFLGLGLPAVEVYRAKEYHDHTYVSAGLGGPALVVQGAEAPFWPRYRRRLLGRPWLGQPLCAPAPGRLEELCSLSHPEIVIEGGGGEVEHAYTLAQRERYEWLKSRLPRADAPERVVGQ